MLRFAQKLTLARLGSRYKALLRSTHLGMALQSISPFDVDGFPILTDEKEDLAITLVHVTNLTARCKVWWSSLAYTGECVVPDAEYAGLWRLTVSLDQTGFFTTTVNVRCRERYYEDPTHGTCEVCPLPGSKCSQPGITLATLPIRAGHWRTGECRVYTR